MKELLFSAALCAFAAPAYAGPLITVTGYSTPDGQGFNDVTTTAMGAADTPYSYYTGPVVFTLSDNTNLTVYCVDLNHFLQSSGTYMLTPLMFNGEGQSISEFDSNRIGHIAAIGAAAWAAGGTDNLDMAAAAQAAIWDISYKTDSPISSSLATSVSCWAKRSPTSVTPRRFSPLGRTGLRTPARARRWSLASHQACPNPRPGRWA
jgi:hypothetical protein